MEIISFQRKRKVGVLSPRQISTNFQFESEQVARGDTYNNTKWKQGQLASQAASLEVASIRHQNDIEIFTSRTHRYFIEFGSRSDIELFTSNRCHPFHVDWLFIIEEMSTNSRRKVQMWNQFAMIHDGINKDTYIETTDNVLSFFHHFSTF